MILNAGPRPTVALSFTRDKAKARTALEKLEVTEAEGSLKESLRLAGRLSQNRPDTDLFVLSDGSRESLDDLDLGQATPRFQPVGISADNVGITALSLRRSPTSSLEQQAFVTVENFSSKEQRATVEVYFDDKLVGVRNEQLTPSKAVSIVFEIPSSGRGFSKRPSTRQRICSQPMITPMPSSPRRRHSILLVGGDRLTAHALRADPRVALSSFPAGVMTILIQKDSTV